MLRSIKNLHHYAIRAQDGDIGEVKDLYFDDDAWAVRYLVVETGSWLSSRKVLVSPLSIRHLDWLNRKFEMSITQAQVKGSPNIDTDKPVSRQNEEQYLGYYGYPYYWGGSGLWGEGLYPYAMVPGYGGYELDHVQRERQLESYLRHERARHRNDDPHLRSCDAVTGYHIQASDGEIGHVSDFLIDDQTWAVRYLVVDTSNWWMGHQVLVAPPWIQSVNWSDNTVEIDMSRESIRSAPGYDSSKVWGPANEQALYSHHGRSDLWGVGALIETQPAVEVATHPA